MVGIADRLKKETLFGSSPAKPPPFSTACSTPTPLQGRKFPSACNKEKRPSHIPADGTQTPGSELKTRTQGSSSRNA